MKKSIFILAMLLMAATAFTQTSRRSANNPTPAREEKQKSTTTNKKEVTTHRSSSQSNSSPAKREVTTRPGNTATQNRSQSGTNNNSVTTRREVTTRQSGTTSQGRTQAGNQQTGTSARRGTASTQHPSGGRTVNNNVNRSQAEHQQRSANHTVRSTPHGSNSGIRYESPRVYRETRVVHHHYNRPPRDRYYRSRHYPYRAPVRFEVYWTPSMRIEYGRYYPMVSHWRYTDGYRIPTVSAYDAILYHGDVMNVYGKVYEVFYTGKTDEYILYFGAYYPYHDFTVVLPGWIARRLSRWPEQYFERQHVIVTGLITAFDDKPEIAIRNTGQIRIY